MCELEKEDGRSGKQMKKPLSFHTWPAPRRTFHFSSPKQVIQTQPLSLAAMYQHTSSIAVLCTARMFSHSSDLELYGSIKTFSNLPATRTSLPPLNQTFSQGKESPTAQNETCSSKSYLQAVSNLSPPPPLPHHPVNTNAIDSLLWYAIN